MPNIKSIADTDVALHLARKPRPRRGSKPKRVTCASSNTVLAGEMLSNFTVESLYKALSKHKISMEWYVNSLIDLASDEATRSSEKLIIYDKLKDLLLLGAIQDVSLAKDLEKKLTLSPKKGSEVSTLAKDPFTEEGLKYHREMKASA